jgi:hypothetical protein
MNVREMKMPLKTAQSSYLSFASQPARHKNLLSSKDVTGEQTANEELRQQARRF